MLACIGKARGCWIARWQLRRAFLTFSLCSVGADDFLASAAAEVNPARRVVVACGGAGEVGDAALALPVRHMLALTFLTCSWTHCGLRIIIKAWRGVGMPDARACASAKTRRHSSAPTISCGGSGAGCSPRYQKRRRHGCRRHQRPRRQLGGV